MLDRLARDRGFYRDELIAEIAQRGGVRGCPRPCLLRCGPRSRPRGDCAAVAPAHAGRGRRHTAPPCPDASILPATAMVDDVRAIYVAAWKAKVKGITVYRYGSREATGLSYAAPKTATGG